MAKKAVLNNKGKPLGSGTISNARRAKRAEKFGVPWSSSSSDWSWFEATAGQERSSSSRAWWWSENPSDQDADSRWQDATYSSAQPSGWLPDAAPADEASSRGRMAPVTPPWKKPDSDDDMLAKAVIKEEDVVQEDPPVPWKLLEATVRTEPSSTSSSDDWGIMWKGAKKVKPLSDESIKLEGPICNPASSSLDMADPEAEAQAALMKIALYPKVMLDWHNVLEVGGHCDETSLKKLLDAGVDVSILSFCYKNRARDVIALAEGLADADRVTRICTTEHRTRQGGKVDLCQDWAIDVIFDDGQDICKEAHEAGLHVYPICTKWEKHIWFKKLGFEPYPSLAVAVDEFLKTYA
jgi:hypothetical protein